MTRYSQTRETLATDIAPNQSGTILSSYLKAVAALELDPEPVPGVNELAERAEALRRHRRQAPDDAKNATEALVAAIAAGTTSPDEAPALMAQHAAILAADPLVVDVLRRAALAASSSAVKLIGKAGEDAIYAVLRPIVAEALDTARKMAPRLEGITSAEDAADAGPTVASAWAQLVAAHRRWVNAHHLAEMLRAEGLLPPTVAEVNGKRVRVLVPIEHQYARPDLMTTPRIAIHRRSPRELIEEAPAGPGLYTTAQAAEHIAAILAAEPVEDAGLRGRARFYGHTSTSSQRAAEVAAILSGNLPPAA